MPCFCISRASSQFKKQRSASAAGRAKPHALSRSLMNLSVSVTDGCAYSSSIAVIDAARAGTARSNSVSSG